MRIHNYNSWWAALLFTCILAILLAVLPADGAKPLTGSQVVTLEKSPDGLWLSQAWVVEWQGPVLVSAIYDTWRRSADGRDWALQYRQLDLAVTAEVARLKQLGVMSMTVGRRMRWNAGGLGGAGPGAWYVMAVVGW